MGLYIALIFILLFVGFQSMGALCSVKVEKHIWLGELFWLSVALAVIAYYWEPHWTMDLYRHFSLVEQYMAGTDFWEMVFRNGLFFWNMFCLVSAGLGNKHLLPVIVVFITYYYFYKSCRICFNNFYIRSRVFLLFLGLHFTLVAPVYVFSGLRNTCAFSALAYCILCICYERNNVGKKILFPLLLSVGIHGASWMVIGLLLLHRVKVLKKSVYVLLLTWSLCGGILGNLLAGIEAISFFVWNGEKLLLYFDNAVAINTQVVAVQFALFCFLAFQLILVSRWMKGEQNTGNKKYLKFLWILMAFSVGSFLMNIVFTRMLYLLGFLLLPFLVMQKNLHAESYGRKFWYCVFVLGDVICITGLSLYQWILLITHMEPLI